MKGTRFTKFICLLLSMMMVLTLLPTGALAEGEETPSGQTPAVTGGSSSKEGKGEDPVVKYTVNFYVGSDLLETQEVADGGFAKRPDDPAASAADAAEGKTFLYWYAKSESVKFYFDTPITKDVDLHALFGVAEETKEEPTEASADKSAAPGTILPEETFLKTYTFMVNDVQYGETQTVATGDTLYEPAAPSAPAGMRFVGWFDSGDTQFTSFGTQTVEANGDITLHAEFVTAYYAFFYNAAGTAVIETRAPGSDNKVSTTNVTALQIAVDEALIGWSLTPGGSVVGPTVDVIGANVNLYPIIQKVKWISFNSNGGTYVSPMYVLPGTALTADLVNAHIASENGGSSTIAKAGYTFGSWSGFTYGNAVTADITLNATWTANTNAPYKLVYWIENADDTNYSFEKTVAKTGTSGAAITPSAADLSVDNLNSSYKTYFNTGTYTPGTTINGDGSSIVNIYYTRKTFTLTFKNGSSNVYSNTFKYDQDISAVWAVAAIKNLLDTGYVWESNLTHFYYSFLQKMPGSNVTMTATKWSGYLHKWYYFLETLDGTAATAPAGSETTTSGGITYYKSRTVQIYGPDSLVLTYDEDYYPITGFTQRDGTVPDFTHHDQIRHKVNGHWVIDQEEYYDASLYYRRSSYSLTFINGDTTNTISNIKCEASIQNQNYTPTRPTGVPSNFVFMGWFTTEGGFAGSEFTWAGKTMPAKNLVLYASWKAPTFTGIAHLSVYGTGGGTYDLGTIPYGGTISSSALSAALEEAELYKPHTTDTFGGWLIERNGSRTLFNASMQIYANVVLYPQWISGVSYHVTYNLNGASAGTAPADGTAYGAGAQAQVLAYDASVVPPTGMVFVGWLGSDGHIYYPGSAITINGDTTLTAQWGNAATAVTLTYNGNGGKRDDNSSSYTISAKNNSRHTVESNTFSNTGKNFVKWNTKPDGSGTDYLEGASVLLSASQPGSPTTLYAIWRTATYSVNASVTPSDKGSITGGTGTFDFGADTTVTWSVDAGYAVSSVTDNTVPVSVTGNSYTLSDLSSDHTIVVTLAKTSFNLTYNGNGGTYSGGTTSTSTLTIGDEYVVPANFFTNTGSYFLGWSISSGGPAESAYAPATTHTMPADNVTLYAIWAAKTDLVLTANSASLNYSGEEQTVSGFTGSISGLTYGGTTTAGGTGTNPGQYATTFADTSGLVITQSGTNVTDRYNVSFVPGTLTINPRVSYINGATGAEYAYEWVTYGTGDATYSITPAQNVTVGTTHYYWTGTWDLPAANDLTANTTITALYATNKQLKITGNSDTVVYDGFGHLIEDATLSDPTLDVTGYTVSGSGTNAGTYDVLVTLGPSFKIMSGGTDVTYQYDVETVKGTLTIDPATLTVTANDETLVYPQTRTAEAALGYTVTSGLVGTQTAGFNGMLAYKDGFATQPLPGSYTNAIEQGTLALADHGTFLAANYTLNFVKGNVNVSSGTFSVSLTDASAVYDGLAHSATLNGTQSSDGIQYFVKVGGVWVPTSSTPSVTNVSDGPKDIKVVVSRTGYTNAEAFATLTITPATLTVSAVDKEITYPAARPAVDYLNYTVSGEVHSEESALEGLLAYAGSFDVQPDKGFYADVIEQGSLIMVDNGAFKASNYTLVFNKGDVTVLAGTFTPTSAGYTGTYDGDEHGLTADVPGVTGEVIYYSTSPDGPFDSTTPPKFTDAGTYTVYFMATDPAGNYNDSSVQSGTVTILPATLTVTAVDKEITYPANRPAEASLNYTVSGEISGEEAAFTGGLDYKDGFAVQPAAGLHSDVIELGDLALTDNGAFKASNYSLSFVKGDLNVLKGTMIPYTDGYVGTYDGAPHNLTAQVDGVDGEVIYYSTTPMGPFSTTPPTFTDAGTYLVYFKAVDPAHNYNDSDVYIGQVIINRSNLLVAAIDVTLTYPETRPAEASLDFYTVSGIAPSEVPYFEGVLAYKSGFDLIPSAGPHTDVIEQGSLVLADAGTFKASNYTLVFNKGDVTVLAGTFTPTTAGYIGTYDGIAHGLTADVPGVTGEVIYYSTSPDGPFDSTTPPTFTNAGTYTVYFKATDPAHNYNDSSVQSGTVTILPATLTVTAVDKTIIYPAARPDEATLNYTVSGEIGSEEAAFTGNLGYASTLGTNPLPGMYTDVIEQGGLLLADNGAFKASNYTISFVKGYLNVVAGTFSVSLMDASAVYNGLAHAATLNGTESDDGIQYFVKEGSAWVPFIGTPSVTNVNDGPKEIKVIVTRTGYTNAEATATLTITPATLTVSAVDKEITYPAARPAEATLNYTASGNVSGEIPAYTGTLAYTGSLATNPAAGSYTEVIEQGDLALADSSTFKASNYSLSFVKGDLTVLAGTFTPTSAGYIGTYDGIAHGLTADVPGVTGEVIYYSASPDGPFDSTTPPTFTNAGTYTVYFKATDPAHNYNDSSVQSGTVTILPATLTVTAVDKTIIYPAARPDEATLNYTVSGEVGTEEAAFTGILGYVSSLGTNPLPGPYTDVIVQGGLLLDDNGAFLASNYTIDFVEGDLSVTSGTFDVSLTDASAVYDGSAHSATLNGTQSGDGIHYFVREGGVWVPVGYTPSVTNVNDGPKEIKVIVSRTGYTNAEATATLTITPVEVTVTADSRSMTFGNTATLTPAEGVTYAGFVNGETSSVVSGTGSITYAYADSGTAVMVDNTLPVGSYSITPDVSGLAATNYTFKAQDGTLAVGIATMTVSSPGYSGVYDGDPHDLIATASVPGMTISYTTVPGGMYFPICPSATDAGTYTVYFKAVDPDGNYANATGSAQIEISKAVLTVTADDQSMTYGDSAATPAGVSYTGFADGEDESVVSGTVGYNYYDGTTEVFIGSTLGAGTYDITPDLSALSATNYTFTPANGTLTVDQATMEVTSDGYDELYDGAAHGLTANVTGLTGMTITYSDSATGTFSATSPEYTDAGTYTVYFKAVDPDGNYANATGSSQIIIRKVEVTVTSDNRSMTYGDTTTLTPAEGVTYAGFIAGEDESLVSGTIGYGYFDGATAVTVSNTLPVKAYDITPDVSGLSATNYTFKPADGTLTVNKATMTVGSTGTLAVYDGFLYDLTATASVPGMTILYSATPDGLFGPICPSYSDAGTYTVYFKAIDPDGNYAEASGHADIVIEKAVLTVRAIDRSMTYGDMATLTVEDASFSGFAFGDNLSNIGMTGSVGYYYFDGAALVTVDATLGAGSYTITPYVGSLSSANYTFVPADGTLTVNRATMTVGASDVTHTYDGTAYSVIAHATPDDPNTVIYYNTSGGTMLSDYFEEIPKAVNVADSTRVYFLAVNPNYEDATGSAMLTITPAAITVTADDRSMTYGDTTTLTPAEGVSYSGFITGENESVVSGTGSITYTYQEGAALVTVDNTLDAGSYSIIPGVGGLSAANYSFVPGNGTLTVNRATGLAINATSYNEKYDGAEHGIGTSPTPADGTTLLYSLTGGTNLSAYTLTSNPMFTDAMSAKTIYVAAVNDNYVTVFDQATVTITRRIISLTSGSETRAYTGLSLSLPVVEVTGDGFVTGEGFVTDPQSTVSITNVGSATNAYNYPAFITGTNVDNYAFYKSEGTLRITAVEVTVTADNQSMTYGDSSATAAGVSYSGFVSGEDEGVVSGTVGYNYYDGATEVFIGSTLGAGIYDIKPDLSGISATNYTFKAANGTLTVSPATMEVTSPGYEDYYDGAAHGLTASVTGLSGMTITYSDSATGTFTSASPEYTNAGTYTVYFKAVDPDGNYSEATGSADIVIHKVEVTVSADNQFMTYGDTTAPAETVTYMGFVNGENATSAGVTGSVSYNYYDGSFLVAVSSTLDAGSYTITPDVSALSAANYTFTPADGALTVAKSEALTVEADNVTGAYNGSAYMVIPTASDLSGTDFWYSLTDSTDPADYSMTPPTLINVADSARVYLMATNLNYENAFGSALVTITPVELTVTPDNQYMTYGDAVLPTESSVITGYVNSENATLAGVTGTIGYSYFDGTTPVTVSSTLPAGDYTIEVDVSGLDAPNYTFTNASGALTVAKSESLTVDAPDINEMYNGGTHMVTPLASDMSADTTIWYSLINSTDPADYSTTAPVLINVDDSATVYLMATNPNYYPAFGDAEVHIRTRVIAIKTNTANKVYDATALTDNGWSYDGGNDGFIGTQGFETAYATGTITNTGFVPNGFYFEFNNDTLTNNYTVNVTEGTLTVTPRLVVIALDPAEKNFGEADPAFTFHYLAFPGLYDVLPGTGVTVNLIRTDAGMPAGEGVGIHYGTLSISVAFADAVAASNYAIVPQKADFTIHPQVTYNLNTVDAVTGFPAPEWFDYQSDATIADAVGVARLGYVLTGWTDDLTGDPITLGQTITGIDRNYSLSAVWELATYSIFYAPNTAMAVTNMPGTQTDVPYTSLATMSGLVPTRAGFTFVHWDTADVPGVLSLDPASTFAMPNNDVTFVAIWEPDLTPVYYHANGGQGGTVEDGPFATLTTVTVAGNGFTRPGYRFIGWSTTPNGGVSAQPGDTFMMPVLQVNYYAQWEQEFYTVTYIVNGGTTAGLDGAVPYAEYTNLAYGDAMPVPADPAQDGYNFDGWTTAVPATVPEGGLTIYGTMTAVTEPEIIPEEPTPLAGASWALLNLILAIATALGSVLMLIGLIGKKRKEELEGVVVRETKKHPVTRLMTLLPAIGGIIAFILTENMKNPMTFVDRWTILMAVIAVLQIALVLLGVKKDKDVDPEAAK